MRIIRDMFHGRTSWQDVCTCDQRHQRVKCCTVKYIESGGVVGVESSTLAQCGKFQQQARDADKLVDLFKRKPDGRSDEN